MSAVAIVMMAISMTVLWGGLIASIWNLARSPEARAEDFQRDL